MDESRSVFSGSSHCGSVGLRLNTVSLRMWIQSLASLSGLKNLCSCKLQCRSQVQLRSGIAVAVAVACSCSSDLTSSLGTSICHRCGPKRQKKKKKKRQGTNNVGKSDTVLDLQQNYSQVVRPDNHSIMRAAIKCAQWLREHTHQALYPA